MPLIPSKRNHQTVCKDALIYHSLRLYHGEKVEGCAGEGNCTEIPQLPANNGAARTRASPAACATAFPAAVSDGLLFVWMVPGADGLLQSSQCAPSSLPFMHALIHALFQRSQGIQSPCSYEAPTHQD
jgi:hypothetical protein